MDIPKGSKFYGSVTVSERGQIVIPADFRRDFGIKAGDKLLVLGNPARGMRVIPFTIMREIMEGNVDFFRKIGLTMEDKESE